MSQTESKLKSLISFAIHKLEGATSSLMDGTPEEDFAELTTFTLGFARNLRNAGAPAPKDLKVKISQVLSPVWDLKTDQPGPRLTVPALHAALEEIITLLTSEDLNEEPPNDDVRPASLAAMSLQDAIAYLWKLDEGNRLPWGDGFTYNLQNKGRLGADRCSEPLFNYVNLQHPFWSRPITKAYLALLDNYERETGKAEQVTAKEREEMSLFLDRLCETRVMQFTYEFLKEHGKDARTKHLRQPHDMQTLVSELWFAPYTRCRPNDSSGFEHVFVGEERHGKVIGLHNWIQFYLEEKKGKINYSGWVGKQDSDYNDDVHLVTVKFSWEDGADDEVEEKPMSTILCGSTVEFELAILTIVFLSGNQDGDNIFHLGSEKINVVCHPQRTRIGGAKIGTAYLEVAR
jgi:poly(U)-specific endoribonuclease